MRVDISKGILSFDGFLDEHTSMNEISGALLKLKDLKTPTPIVVDFSKVSRGNSSGISVWLKFLKMAALQFKYIQAPVWLVSQFNIVHGYFENNSFVQSFYAPYYAPANRASKDILLNVGKDIPIQKDYSTVTMPNIIIDGLEYEFDFDPNQYFFFLAKYHELFAENLK